MDEERIKNVLKQIRDVESVVVKHGKDGVEFHIKVEPGQPKQAVDQGIQEAPPNLSKLHEYEVEEKALPNTTTLVYTTVWT